VINNPDIKTNARHLTNIVITDNDRKPAIARAMDIAQALVLGPNAVFVRRNLDDYKRLRDFERVLQVVRRDRGRGLTAWTVYSQDREWYREREEEHTGCVLSLSQRLKYKELPDGLVMPNFSTVIWYMDEEYIAPLNQRIIELDKLITSGIAIAKRDSTEELNWRELSIFRAFDWGTIDITWNSAMSNTRLEAALLVLQDGIEVLLAEQQLRRSQLVESMEMYYTFPEPDVAAFLMNRF
jgi:hypothetical protein